LAKIPFDPGKPGRLLIAGTPEGHDARVLAELAKRGPLVHVALDDVRLAKLAETIAFFAPEVEVVQFPAWDCLPYDRVSPNGEIGSRRVEALTTLLTPAGNGAPRLVLTTVNAAVQKVPPRSAFENAVFAARVGSRVDVDALQRYLADNGYTRAQTVREPGEYAIRGGIVDLFPPGTDEPLRLDLFGDELEGVRRFDPMLKPVSEAFLDEASVHRFRSGYRELFGAVLDDDPLYEAVSAGRKHAGMEHWLPLFHGTMETLLDYVPGAAVTLDPQVEEACEARFQQIADFHHAREMLRQTERKANVPVYKPLPPHMLYLDRAAWDAMLAGRAVGQLSPFALPDGAAEGVDAGGRRGRDFADARALPGVNVFDAVKTFIQEVQRADRRVLVAAYSVGARDRMLTVLREHGIDRLEIAETWDAARRLDRRTAALVVLGIESGFSASDLQVVTEQDILGDRLARPAKRRRRAANFIAELSTLNEGDLVVHVDHGIGRFDGLETIAVSGAPHDCLRILYEGGDKLYLPVENLELLSRYGSDEAGAQLDRLGGTAWQARKARVKKRIMDMADGLIRIAAERELRKAETVTVPDGLYAEFAARFPYPETEDQLRAIEDVVEDLQSGRPMDRLVCGDVGFGKTEVALRAAFLAAMAGLQVAVVVPALPQLRAALRRPADPRRPALAHGAREGAEAGQGRPGRGDRRHRDRHPCPAVQDGDVQEARSRDR
jgi:transcription-repair coupling factor (superfamily II helicase)